MTAGGVPVKVVPSLTEAEIACSMLRAYGIESSFRALDSADTIAMVGWQEILVAEADVDAARELLEQPGP
jgi:hypothetical protein